ncbi:MAG: NAD-dependent epimerase/dehydratase family protein [Candidatus Aminicenantia bacterium]
MKCLVTGSAGFIGSHLSERLIKEGFKVIGVDSFSNFYPRWMKERNLFSLEKEADFEFIEARVEDLNLKDLFKEIDYIFHLAAQPGVRKSWGNEFLIYTETNIMATQKLLEAAKDYSIKKFIFASSSSVYGFCPDLPMREDSLLVPISPYGVTKLAAEQLCFLYYKNLKLPVTSLRYFTVYGPRQRPDMAFHKFMKSILEEKEIIIYGDGNQTRDFTYIDDVIEATLQAATIGRDGEVYNIGGGRQIKLIDLFPILENITQRKIKFRKTEAQKGEMRHTLASIRKAKIDLKFSPETSLEDGLSKEWQWIIEIHQRKDREIGKEDINVQK